MGACVMWWTRLLIKGAEIFGKTMVEAWKETGKRAAVRASSKQGTIGNISIKESRDILGLADVPVSTEAITKKYDYLYKANDKEGSVYLQAKVTNAKIRLEEALKKGETIE